MKINKPTTISLTLLMALSANYSTANEIHITLPNVPKAPKVNAKVIPAVKVIIHNSSSVATPVADIVKKKEKEKEFTKRVPPNYNKKVIIEKKETSSIGEVSNNKVSVYLVSKFISVDDVISKLEGADFDVLAKYELDANKEYISIVFTNDKLIKSASVDTRGFASSLRLLIDKKNKTININNPLYVMKAFMQEKYDEKLANEMLVSLKDSFEDIKDSPELMKFSHLEKYQFMTGMPYYEDMLEVASGTNDSLLLSARKSEKVIYEQKLNNGSTILGIKLSKSTSGFIKTIGYNNAELLPYPILIENNKAKILAPKYYIALMYPTLSMSQFMSISSIPGEIETDCDKVFR